MVETTEHIEGTTSVPETKYSTIISSINKITTNLIDIKEYSTQKIVQTTVPTTLNQTPEIEIHNSTIIIPSTEIAQTSIVYSLVLIGYSHFKKEETKVKFNIYFECLNGLFYSKRLIFPIIITTNRVLRILETYEAVCDANEEEISNKISYSCEIQARIENIKSVEIIKDFKFSSANTTVTTTPLAEEYKDKIQEVGQVFDNLINSNIYILNHSQIQEIEKNYFNVSGIINGTKPKFQKIDINLMAFTNIENEVNQAELNCSIVDIIDNNYTINCKGEKTNANYELQNAISYIDDEILLINFDEGAKSNISFESTNIYRRYGFSNKSGSLNAGGIIAIILAIIVAIIALIAAFIFLRKDNTKIKNRGESVIVALKN